MGFSSIVGPVMNYFSTRGGVEPMPFGEAVMSGLARDGGLLLPETIPDVRERLDRWADLSYRELAFEVMRLFADDLTADELRALVTQSYAGFDDPEVTPVKAVGPLHILELFHGPTLAFKDLALQFLGRLFETLLARSGSELNLLAATSGDTGSAAIQGVRGRRGIRIFVMHPRGCVSPIQERQMTTVLDDNVFNLSVAGTFDDCQGILKTLFSDLSFKDRYALGSVNSINWARVMAQVVYYFYAGLRVRRATGAAQVQFAVPTGNFGDIFAGWIARRMGLPVRRLILATNENDILARFFNSGVYARGAVHATLSPSMDIQVASNFERYLFYRVGGDSARLRELMEGFARAGRLTAPLQPDGTVDAGIAAGVGDTAATRAVIRDYYERYGYLLDPHTAVGVHVASAFLRDDTPTIALATAHPAKFSKAVHEAIGRDLAHHPALDALLELPTRCTPLPAEAGAVRDFVRAHCP